MFCKNRIWSNGDMEDCGKSAGSHGYCAECLVEVKKSLYLNISQHIKDLYFLNNQILDLELAEKLDKIKSEPNDELSESI